MSLSVAQLQSVIEEIRALVSASPVRKAYCEDGETFVLELRAVGANHLLLFSLVAGGERLHFVDQKPTQPAEPAAFVMLLRKHLVGARFRSVKQLQEDRIVSLQFERAEASEITLLCELMRRGANVFLLDRSKRILGMQLANRSRRRRLVTGERYVLPEPPSPEVVDRARGDDLSLAELPADGQRSARLQAHYLEKLGNKEAARQSHAALRRLRRERKAMDRRAAAIERDLARAREAEQFRKWGELLQSAHGRIPRGEKIGRVPDYYVEGMPEVEIPLDVKLDLQGNIDRYFKQYRKFQGAVSDIESRLERTRERLGALERAFETVADLAWHATAGEVGERASDSPRSMAEGTADDALEAMDDVLRELEAQGWLPRPRVTTKKKSQATPAVPYREFQSKSGRAILVGKGAKQNDQLTLHVAKGNDLWLHAHDWAGSHVVVKLDRNEDIDQESLLDAATLAAHYSGAKSFAIMEVIHTRAKNVRKPKGFPPGKVLVSQTKTITVRREDDRLARLMGRDSPG
jgi:predicted ribosome quality control (RQC) complex YloA/Tae2 family protein